MLTDRVVGFTLLMLCGNLITILHYETLQGALFISIELVTHNNNYYNNNTTGKHLLVVQ